jgi:hypothetical protein
MLPKGAVFYYRTVIPTNAVRIAKYSLGRGSRIAGRDTSPLSSPQGEDVGFLALWERIEVRAFSVLNATPLSS